MKLVEEHVLYGPGRRSEETVIELWLQAEPGEARALADTAGELRADVLEALRAKGFDIPVAHPLRAAPGGDPVQSFARIVGGIALALQQQAGHRVAELAAGAASEPLRCWMAFEYEHPDVGIEACRLALQLAGERAAGIEWAEAPMADDRGFEAHLGAFLERAAGRVLPRDAEAIIDAAKRLDVPCVKLEREPYQGVSGDFRIRPHGLLKLGHACRQRVVDGTFPIDGEAALAALVHDRGAVGRALDALGLPRPPQAGGDGVCVSTRSAVRAAERIGFPVALRPVVASRLRPRLPPGPHGDAATVRAAAEQALKNSPGVLVEAWISGQTCRIVVAHGEVVAAVLLENGVGVAEVTAQTHPDTLERAAQAGRRLGAALFTLTVVCEDVGLPLEGNGVVVDLDVAPALDRFLPEGAAFPAEGILDRAAEGLVRHLFPAGTPSRIPLVAVTGTNGKTTVSTLIARTMEAAGYVTGRSGTTGLYQNGRRIQSGDLAGGTGHHRVLESPEVQFGVLETARGGVTHDGLMFDRCDVAVCTNVSPDHLGLRGIDTVEQMAALKLLIVQRARDVVVLNADCPHSLAMLPRLPGRRAWLVSTRQSATELRERHGPDVRLCVIEEDGRREWISLHAEGGSRRLMAVDEIPITFGGRVRYNISNAMQAAAVCYEAGATPDLIRGALAGFAPGFEENPGRLNFHHGSSFTVLFDYAHNEDGHAHLADFVATLDVPGRKVLAFSASASRTDDGIMNLARCVAGHYDFYICRCYPKRYTRRLEEVPPLLRRGLEEAGVEPAAIVEDPDPDVLRHALALCEKGDLLVYCASASRLDEDWETITSWPGNRFRAAPSG